MSTATPTRVRRAASLAEKTILGFIAGAAASIAVVEVVLLAQRVVGILVGPVSLTIPTTAPLDAGIRGATFDRVTVEVATLSAGGRTALVAAAVLGALLTVGICLVVAWLCVRVFRGKPFVRSATVGIASVAILVLLVALGVPTLDGIAQAEATAEIGSDLLPVFLVEIDPAPVGWTFALAVVVAAFEIGQRLQRDQDGLV